MLLATFAAAIFLSAALLFAVQPLFAKMVLPRFGGSPSVWSVAMVFFQSALLAGYAYAHVITTHLSTRTAVLLHVALLIAATIALPLGVATSWDRPPSQGEAFWLLGLFTVSLGLPFFALSANGPLLQAWFARTAHPAAKDPYFLYAASNVGSFLALVSYPALVEPFTRLGEQTIGWSAGFLVLIALVAMGGLLVLRSPDTLPAGAPDTEQVAAPGWREALVWIALAAVPSALLIAVTAHMSTDVAAAPMLWVVPLALYLLTFVIVFQTHPILPHRWMLTAQPALIVLLIAVLASNVLNHIFVTIAIHLLAFFVTAMVCHGELARRRPPPRRLTAFYLSMSLGGVIGGIAAGLVAPRLFSWVAEYPLLIALAILCRPGLAPPSTPRQRAGWIAAPLAAAAIVLPGLLFRYDLDADIYRMGIGALLALAFVFRRDTLTLAGAVALTFMVVHLYGRDGGERESRRSFFGVHRIVESDDGQYRLLMHGTTTHGAQRIRNDDGDPTSGRPEPLSYYHAASPLAQAITAVQARKKEPVRIGVVGLGTGSLACYVRPGDTFDVYEIDPTVVQIARNPNLFSFLASCAPDAKITLGDARLTLAAAADGIYDVLVIDAFSSDAIPVHLLTREAMSIYRAKLAPGGIALLHVSNRHMELASVVAGIAATNDMIARKRDTSGDDGGDEEDEGSYKYASTVVAVARDDADFGQLAENDAWEIEEPDPDQRVWTDDYSNILGAMIRKAKEE